MTLKTVIEQTAQAGYEPLLTLRQVAALTGTPLATVRRWAYNDKVLPVVRFGPRSRIRVRLSTVLQFFPDQSVSISIKLMQSR